MPVSIGGMIVHLVDIMVGDKDGLVVVPLEHAEDILQMNSNLSEIS